MSPLWRTLTCLALVGLAGCGSTITDGFEQCTLRGTLNTEEAAAGDLVVVSGGPFGPLWDNLVEVDGVAAQLVESVQTERLDEAGEVVEVDACARCETCRSRAAGTCNRCYQACGNCVETLSFVIPPVDAGSTAILVTNSAGSSAPLPFAVTSHSQATTETTTTSMSTGTTGSGTPGATP